MDLGSGFLMKRPRGYAGFLNEGHLSLGLPS